MNLTLSQFHDMVSDEANKGDRLDDAIPTFVRRAGRFIERNYNFLYMERFAEIDLDISAENPRFLAWPSILTKKINFVRYTQPIAGSNQSKFKYLNQVDPITINTIEPTADPNAYWITGDNQGGNFMVLDQIGEENLTFETHYVEYSTWPESAGALHWLFDNAEDVLLAQTMRMMAPYANEPEWKAAYKEMWDEGIRTLLMVDEDARSAGPADGYKMVYR